MDEEQQEKTCAWCNKETALALFGVAIGLLFIAMSLDTLRRMRMAVPTDEGTILREIDGEVVE